VCLVGSLDCGICRDNKGKLVEAGGACGEALVEKRCLGIEVQNGVGMAVLGLPGVFVGSDQEVEVQIGSPSGSPSRSTANIAANIALISSLLVVEVVPVIDFSTEASLPIAAAEPGDPENAIDPGDGGATSNLVF